MSWLFTADDTSATLQFLSLTGTLSLTEGWGAALDNVSVLAVNPNPVPVPAAVWLFGTALIGLVGFGKRRKAA
jgi:ABC-type antimicrobial peptide transport system permease subunit